VHLAPREGLPPPLPEVVLKCCLKYLCLHKLMSHLSPAVAAPPRYVLLVVCAVLLALGSAPALATCPPEDLLCWPLPADQLVPDAATPMLTMQARIWPCTVPPCSIAASLQSADIWACQFS